MGRIFAIAVVIGQPFLPAVAANEASHVSLVMSVCFLSRWHCSIAYQVEVWRASKAR